MQPPPEAERYYAKRGLNLTAPFSPFYSYFYSLQASQHDRHWRAAGDRHRGRPKKHGSRLCCSSGAAREVVERTFSRRGGGHSVFLGGAIYGCSTLVDAAIWRLRVVVGHDAARPHYVTASRVAPTTAALDIACVEAVTLLFARGVRDRAGVAMSQ